MDTNLREGAYLYPSGSVVWAASATFHTFAERGVIVWGLVNCLDVELKSQSVR